MNRRKEFQDTRTDSTALLTKTPLKDLEASDTDVPKVLFLSVKPIHVKHEETDSGSNCTMCRLIQKFKEAIQKKSIRPLKRELKVKTIKLCAKEINDQENVSTLESNFADIDEEMNLEDEELITFGEVLELLNIPVPEVLQELLITILKQKKVPVEQNAPSKKGCDETKKKNRFLSYTMNKKLSGICDTMSIDEVFAMKEFILTQKEEEEKMVEALSVITDLESMKEIQGMKEIIFFYIILTMLKESLLDRLYTHTLEHFLDGIKQHLPNPESRTHIDKAVNTLKRYPLTVSPPGICIIFSMLEDRPGADNDVRAVRQVFEEEFNFDVFVKIDPTKKSVKTLIEKLSSSRNMFYDSLVVWFMAHGDKSNLKLKDGEIHRRTELLQPFAEIGWLKKKPKLFFIQACANKNSSRKSVIEAQSGMATSSDSFAFGMSSGPAWKEKYGQYADGAEVNPLADTLVSYATLWYKPASRADDGCLYVATVLDCLVQLGRKTSIENVLREMHYRVNTIKLGNDNPWKQTPYYESSLQKEFILP